MKTKTKQMLFKTLKQVPMICFIVVSAFTFDYLVGSATVAFVSFMRNPVKQYSLAEVNVARAEEQEMPIRLYVLQELYKAGIDVDKADKIIECESHYNENAININRDKTFDAGIWQINSIHKDITLKDKIDYKESTKWAINKIKRDGGFNAWACNRLIARN
jgi:hypothetical protein